MTKVLIFDSGIGGMTILHKINLIQSGVSIVYVADDLFFPYGNKTDSQLKEHIYETIKELVKTHAPDALVLACNTATLNSIDKIKQDNPGLITVGVEPGVKYLMDNSVSRITGILSTVSTIDSPNTQRLINSYSADMHIETLGSSNLAIAAEDYILTGTCNKQKIQQEIGQLFYKNSKGHKTDIIAMGCTHYRLLQNVLDEVSPWKVQWFDPAPAVASRLMSLIDEDISGKTNSINFTYTSAASSEKLELAWIRVQQLLD